MLFNSIEFAIFFPTVTLLFFLLPHRIRWVWLLAASCIFYAFFIPAYIAILVVTILIDYIAGIKIEDASSSRARTSWLIVSIISTCLVLCIFKYYAFTKENIDAIARLFDLQYSLPALKIILPIGLSFHTFQSLSYVIEVYRGNQKAERHLGIYSLYVMFYPQLVAGPIERPQNLLHQFHEVQCFDYERAVSGLALMGWGLTKKVLVADRLSPYVDHVYSSPGGWSGLTHWVATVFFAIQIYCDFSGYSDIARGCARVMGFRLMRNFDTPYFSASIGEFWRRWHISLSTWFKDYVFIPLGGSRASLGLTCRNLMVTFVLSGFWHGANWTFVVWGTLNGLFLVSGVLWARFVAGASADRTSASWIARFPKILLTFFLINITWVFFRAPTFPAAFEILTRMFTNLSISRQALSEILAPIGRREFVISAGAILTLLTAEIAGLRHDVLLGLRQRPFGVRWAVYGMWAMILVLLGRWSGASFIYFQF